MNSTRSYKHVVLSMFLAFITLILSITSVSALETSVSSDLQTDARLRVLFQQKLDEIKESDNTYISSIKTATDFDGKEYSIVECCPIGYMIYSNDTGVFVEYSPSSFSPYLNFSESLYYGGPTFYYRKTNDQLIHTLEPDETIAYNDIQKYANSSQYMYNVLYAQKDTNVLNFVNGKTSKDDLLAITSYALTVTNGAISHPEFYSNLSNFGYWSGDNRCPNGCCGFIGLNMLIAYHDKYKNNSIMDDKYWYGSAGSKTGLYNQNASLTKYLFDLDPKSSTTSMHIHSVMKQYVQQRGVSVTHTSLWAPFFGDSNIRDKIDHNVPVELFGNIVDMNDTSKNINHAVVAYRYRRETGNGTDSTSYTVHYGWPGYTSVVVKFPIGSIYCFE